MRKWRQSIRCAKACRIARCYRSRPAPTNVDPVIATSELRFPSGAKRCARFALAMVVALAGAAAAADTGDWPRRPIRILAGQQAGSATDNLARLAADALEVQLGVAVAVENRPGAGGQIGAEAAARAAPDGYTLLVGGFSNLVISAATVPDLRYNPVTDFVPIGRFAHVPFGLAVHPAVPAHTLGELAELARAQPGKLTYVSLGPATITGFGMAKFLSEANVDMLAVEYRGIGSAIPDVLSGRVDVLFNEVAVLAQHAQDDGLRVLAIASPRRAARMPTVPTTAEQGFPRVVVAPWYGLLAPAGTPPDVLKRLGDAYRAAVRSPTLRRRIEAMGYEPMEDAPEQFATALREEIGALRATMTSGGRASPP
jgi:tripartite-type tricarboxylate transporter receptor subunit TctC